MTFSLYLSITILYLFYILEGFINGGFLKKVVIK